MWYVQVYGIHLWYDTQIRGIFVVKALRRKYAEGTPVSANSNTQMENSWGTYMEKEGRYRQN